MSGIAQNKPTTRWPILTGPAMRDTERPDCLSDLKRLVLEDVSLAVHDLEGGRDLVREGAPQMHCPLLLEGFGRT